MLDKLAKLRDPEILRKNVSELAYRAKERLWAITKPQMPDPVFVVGCSRAGTTVTFETLRAASELKSFPFEIPQFWHRLRGPQQHGWDSEAASDSEALPSHRDAAFAYFYSRLGAGRILDKSCINTLRIPYLNALFPRAFFVYVIRDGRDNISSLMEGWRQRGRFDLRQYLGDLPEKVSIENGEFQDWCFFLPPGWRNYNHASLAEVCAYQWITANRMALDAKPAIDASRWIELRYEDLFDRPVDAFGEVFERLDIPFTAPLKEICAGLSKRPTSIVNGPPAREKWRTQNPQAVESISALLRETQRELGYGE